MQEVEFILYVADQAKSTSFYQDVFRVEPSLNVPGMTEFMLLKNVKLGLMPENGIAKIIEKRMPHPALGSGIPRCELYFRVDTPKLFMERAIQAGAVEVSPLELRDWGDLVTYLSDLDGHIIAFAKKSE